MIGNAPKNRDELLVTGIPPATGPVVEPVRVTLTEPRSSPGTAPVFVDASGWRARLGRRLGLLTGAVLLVFLGALGLGATMGTDVPLTSWNDPTPRPPVTVDTPTIQPERTSEPPAAARPRPTGGAQSPVTSTASRPPSTERATPPATAPTAVPSTSRPGRSRATPPAWGRSRNQ